MFKTVNKVIVAIYVEILFMFVFYFVRPLVMVSWVCLSQMHVING